MHTINDWMHTQHTLILSRAFELGHVANQVDLTILTSEGFRQQFLLQLLQMLLQQLLWLTVADHVASP